MKITKEYYDAKYFESDKYGGKKYHLPNGTVKEWGYIARQYWEGWDSIIPVMKRLFKPKRILDVGCGCGSFVAFARKWGLDAEGIDYSEWAISHPVLGAEGHIHVADASEIPYPDKSFDFVLCSDTLEHIYVEDLDRVISELYRVSSKWIFLNIGAVMNPEIYRGVKPFFIRKGQTVPKELEGVAVAGHVTVAYPDFWILKLISDKINRGWRFRQDLVQKFRRLVPSEVIANWTCIIVIERCKNSVRGAVLDRETPQAV